MVSGSLSLCKALNQDEGYRKRIMEEHPNSIEKRHFTCIKCGYNVQVHGEMYFDYGCYNYIATFSCNQCQILFEGMLTKIDEWDTPGDFIYDLDDDNLCLNCGTSKNVIWNKQSGKCPKCSGDMVYSIDGEIKVHSLR